MNDEQYGLDSATLYTGLQINNDVAAPKEPKRKKKGDKLDKNDELASKFTGGAFSRYFRNALVMFVSSITLYLAYPAMHCWVLRWESRHTFINGRQLRFDGTGSQLFGKYLLWAFLSFITLGVYFIVAGRVNFIKWQTKHTHFADSPATADDNNSSFFDGKWYQLFGVNFVARLVTVITLSFGLYWAYCYKQRWFCKHKTVDGERLCFTGKGLQYFGKCFLWSFLTIITLGIYSFWYTNNVKKWLIYHTQLASFVESRKLADKTASTQPLHETNNIALVGFVITLMGGGFVFGLILSIIGLCKAQNYKKRYTGLAIAGIIISSLTTLAYIGFILYIYVFSPMLY